MTTPALLGPASSVAGTGPSVRWLAGDCGLSGFRRLAGGSLLRGRRSPGRDCHGQPTRPTRRGSGIARRARSEARPGPPRKPPRRGCRRVRPAQPGPRRRPSHWTAERPHRSVGRVLTRVPTEPADCGLQPPLPWSGRRRPLPASPPVASATLADTARTTMAMAIPRSRFIMKFKLPSRARIQPEGTPVRTAWSMRLLGVPWFCNSSAIRFR